MRTTFGHPDRLHRVRRIRARGFSLIELTAVLLILSIAAAAVALRMDGPMNNARMEDVIERIIAFDQLTRDYARGHDRAVQMVVNVSDGRLGRTDERGTESTAAPMVLPEGFVIARLRLRGQELDSGSIGIGCSTLGLTPSYAMRIDGPGGRRQWIVVAGLTGECVQVDDERERDEIFEAAGVRTDAD